jgi:hypothetical protein
MDQLEVPSTSKLAVPASKNNKENYVKFKPRLGFKTSSAILDAILNPQLVLLAHTLEEVGAKFC